MAVNDVVLPALRTARLSAAIDDIVGDRKTTLKIMDAVAEHLESNAMRWGNACPLDDCRKKLSWEHEGFMCPEHGIVRESILLVGFYPLKTEVKG